MHHQIPVVGLFAGLLLVILLSTPLHSQVIRGVTTDADTRAPVAGVLITVRDSTRRVRNRVLTDQAGRFVFTAPPGTYQLTAEHIAFHPLTRATVADGQSAPVQFVLKPAAIALAAVVAKGTGRCGKTSDKEAAKVWYFARTALGAASAETTKRFRMRMFTRLVDLDMHQVAEEKSEFQLKSGRHSFRAAPIDSLLQFGFVQDRERTRFYYGPDAELLLADEFVDAHCFGVVREASRRGQIGLSFWPKESLSKRGYRGIRGKLWVEEQTGMLRFVEYNFTGFDDIAPKYASGRVDFERLPDQTWYVKHWYNRMPRHARVSSGIGMRSSLIGAEEVGGEVLGIDSSSVQAGAGTVQGVLYDSIGGRPLADARVYLSGTHYADSTDMSGQFKLDGVTAGTHYIAFFHPSMTTLPKFQNLKRIEVPADRTITLDLAIPAESSLLALHCDQDTIKDAAARLRYRQSRLAVIAGTVRNASGPVIGAHVGVHWDVTALPQGAINTAVRGAWAETAHDGSYAICGVPADLDAELGVLIGKRLEHREFVRGGARRAVRKDIQLKD